MPAVSIFLRRSPRLSLSVFLFSFLFSLLLLFFLLSFLYLFLSLFLSLLSRLLIVLLLRTRVRLQLLFQLVLLSLTSLSIWLLTGALPFFLTQFHYFSSFSSLFFSFISSLLLILHFYLFSSPFSLFFRASCCASLHLALLLTVRRAASFHLLSSLLSLFLLSRSLSASPRGPTLSFFYLFLLLPFFLWRTSDTAPAQAVALFFVLLRSATISGRLLSYTGSL